MQRAKVRKNYQVTLPKNFLDKVEKKLNLKIQVGDEIDFDVTQDKKIAVKIIRKKEEQIYP
ncbi:MAG: AbrB/MazE/SpoVT family DNA-binding domain-containing protein [Candidatus Hydrothermarchaeota archaeon]|nr:AbrB/MazE/SpoVT family DNA-binding domain-containing protein [Candidatus Hydrothermarchaeota archaeon]